MSLLSSSLPAVWPDLAKIKNFGNFLKVYLLFEKFSTDFGKFCMPFGNIFIGVPKWPI